KIFELVEAMNDVCNFTENVPPEQELKVRENILDTMMQQIIDCGIFIQNYCKDGDAFLARRALKHELSNIDQAIETYKQKFIELKQKFHQWTSLVTEVRVARLADAIIDISEDITLLQMQCVHDAGYKSDKCCLPDTRIKVIRHICQWIGEDTNSPQIYLLTGPAGAGKSSLAHSVYAACIELGFSGSFFAFSRDKPNSLEHCFRTIARDLSDCDAMIKKSLAHILKLDHSLTDTSSLPDQFEKLILEPIQKVSVSRPILIVIDALDEAGTVKTRQQILKLLTNPQHLARIPSNIRFFITSRHEKDILEDFKANAEIQCVQLPEKDEELKADVYTMVCDRLKNSKGLLFKGLDDNHCHYIAEKAEGLFQWAAVVCDFIKGDGRYGQSPLKRYNQLFDSKGGSSHTLYWLYSQVLDLSFGPDGIEHLCSIIGLILCLQEPMPLASLKILYSVINPDSEEDIGDVLPYLGSILTGTNGFGAVHPVHTSVRDYFTDTEGNKEYGISMPDYEARVALGLLQFLNSKLKFNMWQITTSYMRNADNQALQKAIIHPNALVPLEVIYTSCYMGRHLAGLQLSLLGDQIDEFQHALGIFLTQRILYWFEVLGVQKVISVGITCLSEIIKLLPTKETNLIALARDGINLMRMAGSVIQDATAHLYISVLPFLPRNSALRQQWIKYSKPGAKVIKGLEDQWPALEIIIHEDQRIRSVEFSPDGQKVVSASEDEKIRIWNADTGELITGPLEGHSGSVSSVSFSPNGQRIVSGSSDFTIRIWNADTGELITGPLEGHSDWVSSVSFSSDGQMIVSGSYDQTIRIWNADTGDITGLLEGHSDCVNSVSFSSDGQRIVSGSDDQTIRIWNADTGELITGPLEGHSRSVSSVSFSSNGQRIVSGSSDFTIRIWNADTGELITGPLEGHSSHVSSVSFSSNGQSIVSGSWDRTIRIWNADTGELITGPLEGHSGLNIRIWNADTGELITGPLEGHSGSVSSVTFSSDGQRIVSGSDDQTIRIWNADTGELIIGPLEGHSGSVSSVSFSSNGRRIVSGSYDQTIRIWNADTGELITGPLEGHSDRVTSVSFSSDGLKIVSGSFDKTIRIWNADTGELITGPLKGHSDWVSSVSFSSDGQRIVSGSWDKTIRIWNADTEELITGPLEGHSSWVLSVSFSSDGQRIVSGSDDQTIRIWNADTGELITEPLEGHSGSVSAHQINIPGMAHNSQSKMDYSKVYFDKQTGWIYGPQKELLFWIPSSYRVLWVPRNTAVFGRKVVTLDLSQLPNGTSWTECWDKNMD
ncbi:hypothetical protein M422DRAFT_180537, partial [Sphaerobolus stellatus SS14]